MGHMLAHLRGVDVGFIGKILKADAAQHAAEGFSLEYLWKNVDDADEVVFLFRANDLARAKRFIDRVHAEARTHDPKVNLPQISFLEEHIP